MDVTGDSINTEIAGVIFGVRMKTYELYVIDTTGSHPGSTFLVGSTTDTILSLAVHDNLWHVPMFPGVKVENYYRSLDSTSRDKRAAKLPRPLALLLQRCLTRFIVVLLNKDSSAIAYTVLMSVNSFMLATILL